MEQNVPVSGQCSPTVQEDLKVEAIRTQIICSVLKELKKDCAMQTYANILNAAAAVVGIPVYIKLYTNTLELKFTVDGIKLSVDVSKDVVNEVINSIVENISAIGAEEMNDKAFKEAALQPIIARMPWLKMLLKNRS